MYCPETIRKLNAQATVRREVEINNLLLKVKHALARTSEINSQLDAIRRLRQLKPSQARQLQLAEQFYTTQRKSILALQEPALHLGEILAACKLLLEEDEGDILALQGRLAEAEFSGNSRILSEINTASSESTERQERLKAIVAEIQETLDEYGKVYNRQLTQYEFTIS